MEELYKVIEEYEADEKRGWTPGYKIFRSLQNQPNLLTINSINSTTNTQSSTGFSSFDVALPRPILRVDSLQLVNANIPQNTPNIPDRACVFWYYRLSEYSGKVPNPQNLFFVRLLPSYYKQENIKNPSLYGYNRSFVSYSDLATQLALACSNDLSRNNQIDIGNYQNGTYQLNFLPNDISLTYNSSINRFQMTGSSASYQLAYKYYSAGTTYGLNDVVASGGITYLSLQASNTGRTPSSSPTWWKTIYVDIVATWSATTPYYVGRYVSYNNQLWVCATANINQTPATGIYWTLSADKDVNYRYLIAGYNDPNVALAQGTGLVQWNPYSLFEASSCVQYNGAYYQAIFQNQNTQPFSVSLSYTWNTTQQFYAGDVCLYGSAYYLALLPSLNQTPSPTSIYWIQQAWSVYTTSPAPPPIFGLNLISQQTDMFDSSFSYGVLAPFPEGIPGQPFNSNPQRLLNSILGFVWNGVMNPQSLATIVQQQNQINLITGALVLLYNRLRPIPPYTSSVGSGLGAGTTSLVSQTFTAEGYANLNYTSIISLYTTIVSASTLDTNKNTNLLATCPINCANLGVSFFEPKIANDILLRGVDLNTISISMFDEFGDPYFITNNGAVSLTLRVAYRDMAEINNRERL
jgi:hypothetical protein